MFCSKLRLKIKLLLKQFDSYLEKHVDTALTVTTALKKFLASPVAQVLTAIIPSDIDEVIRVKLLYGLGIAIDGLNIIDECKDVSSLEDKVQCFINALKKLNPEAQDAVFAKLASILARTLDDDKKAQNIYDLFVQAKFSASK